MERLRGIHRIIIPVILSYLITNVWCGGSSSTISIYQSTSSVPPLAESFSEGACIIPQTARQLDPKWVNIEQTLKDIFLELLNLIDIQYPSSSARSPVNILHPNSIPVYIQAIR